ncbi:MAG TPA: murein biosynthesis integral membrane protein MurJ [Chloroflexota bacterium]|nr:murein biosynthesis integral membrane protein MurJ [Chloroflexota bacterium]
MLATERTRQLAGAAAIVMAAYVCSRLTGVLREIAISYRFGTGPQLDAYNAAVKVPDIIFQVVAGAAVTSAFIPVYTRYLAKDEQDQAWEMVRIFFTLALVVLLPVVLVAMVFAPSLMPLMVPNFTPDYQALAANLARIVLLSPVFFTLGCFTTSALNAHHRFLLAALAPTTYNVGIILGAVVLGRSLGVYGLALGALIGSAGFLLIQVPGLRQIGFAFHPRLDLRHRGVQAVGRLIGPRAVGLAVAQVNFLVTLVLASRIRGGISSLNYAWQLTLLPLGIFAMAISTAVFPALAEQGATDNHSELSQTLLNATRFILYLTIPACIGLVVLSHPIVRLLYQRGEFTATSTTMTADALRLYAIGLFGMATTEIVTRAFYALHDTLTPVKVAALAMVVNLALALVLIRTMGENGLALATALASTVEAVALFAVAHRRVPGLEVHRLAGSALKSLAASLLMGAIVLGFIQAAAPLGRPLGGLLLVLGAVAIGGAVYLGVTALLGSSEVGQLRRLLRRGIS